MDAIRSPRLLPIAAAFLALFALACDEANDPAAPDGDFARSRNVAPAPPGLVPVSFGGASLTLWPYTTENYVQPKDPVNLVFLGQADPRSIRAALLSLNEDHAGFPVPLPCRWQDVPEGGVQSVYADGRWDGSAIQLSCGDYSTLRFHLRLFRAGDWTVGGAHVEFLIPGTTEHQVISWEVAEQFVAYDLWRSGVGGPVGAAAINDAPFFRTIPAQIAQLMPDDLKAIACPTGVTLPWDCSGSTDVGILTDGEASILYVGAELPAETGSFKRTTTIQMDQAIPKPFCVSADAPFIYVTGPIEFREHWRLTPSGNYLAHFVASGTLTLVPLDASYSPVGLPYQATVYEEHRTMLTDHQSRAAQVQMQSELPPDAPFHGILQLSFGTGPNGMTSYSVSLTCGE